MVKKRNLKLTNGVLLFFILSTIVYSISWSPGVSPAGSGKGFSDIAVADLNGDGTQDLVAATIDEPDGNGIYVYPNSDKDNFYPSDFRNGTINPIILESIRVLQVETGVNDSLDIEVDSVNYSATISNGHYLPGNLATEIQTQLNNLSVPGTTFTCIYNTDHFEISAAGFATSFSILWQTGTNSSTTIGNVIAFDTLSDDTTLSSYSGNTLTSTYTDGKFFDVEIADINHDGKKDIIGASENGIRVYLNTHLNVGHPYSNIGDGTYSGLPIPDKDGDFIADYDPSETSVNTGSATINITVKDQCLPERWWIKCVRDSGVNPPDSDSMRYYTIWGSRTGYLTPSAWDEDYLYSYIRSGELFSTQYLDIMITGDDNFGGNIANNDQYTFWTLPINFVQNTSMFTNYSYKSIKLSDINNDGVLDIVGINETLDRVDVFEISLTGTDVNFTQITSNVPNTGVGQNLNCLSLADIDIDGIDDLVVTSTNNGIFVFKNGFNGTSYNWTTQSKPVTNGIFYDVVINKIDKDDYFDIVATSEKGCYVWYGDGGANWEWQKNAKATTPSGGGSGKGSMSTITINDSSLVYSETWIVNCVNISRIENFVDSATGSGADILTDLIVRDSYANDGEYWQITYDGSDEWTVESKLNLADPWGEHTTKAITNTTYLSDNGEIRFKITGTPLVGQVFTFDTHLAEFSVEGDVSGLSISNLVIEENYTFDTGSISFIIKGGNTNFEVSDSFTFYTSAGPTTDLNAIKKFNSVALADINNDSNLDIVLGTDTNEGVPVYFGNGYRGWQAADNNPFTSGSYSSVHGLADFNFDGNPDIIACQATNGIQVAIGTDSDKYTFQGNKWEQFSVKGTKFKGLDGGDLDKDALIDVVGANIETTASYGIQVEKGDGIGNWDDLEYPTSSSDVNYLDVIIVDYNNDGYSDIVASKSGGGVFAWPLIGKDSFNVITSENDKIDLVDSYDNIYEITISNNTYTGNNLATAIQTGLNNAVTGVPSPDIYTVTYSLQSRKFNISETQGRTFSLLWASGVNGRSQSGENIGQLLGYNTEIDKLNSSNYFSDYPLSSWGTKIQFLGTSGNNYSNLCFGDYDNDGDFDIFGANNSIGIDYWENTSSPNYFSASPLQNIGTVSFWGIDCGDINSDGTLDLVATDNSVGGVYVFSGDGTGNFTPTTRPTVLNNQHYGVVLADLDNDSFLDIVASSGNGIEYWFGNDRLTWTTPRTLNINPSFTNYRMIDVGDFDNDGWLDIASANQGGGVHVWINTSNSINTALDGANFRRGFGSYTSGPVTTGTYYGIKVIDFSNDGLLDLLVAGQNGLISFRSFRDFIPPQVSSTSPTTGSTQVSNDTSITVNFNEIMDSQTLNAETIIVEQKPDGAVSYQLVTGAVTYTTSTATFEPNSPFESIAEIRVTVKSGPDGVRDYSGNQLDGNNNGTAQGTPLDDYIFTFTVGDSEAPNRPLGLVATAGNNKVYLRWDGNSETDLGGYKIYRNTTSGSVYQSGAPIIAEVSSTTLMYIDETAINGSTYYYVIQAVDIYGNESLKSSPEVSALPNDIGIPSPPSNFEGVAGDTLIHLNWDEDLTVTGYRIYRRTTSTPNNNYSLVVDINDNTVNSYLDDSLVNSTVYSYIITTYNGTYESNPSTEISLTPISSTSIPEPPSYVNLIIGDSRIHLSWENNLGGNVDGYNVYRRTSLSSWSKINSSLITGNSFFDTTVTNGTEYFYVITSLNEGTTDYESEYSPEASGIPSGTITLSSPTLNLIYPGSTINHLYWDTVSNADGYKVYRSTSSGNNYILVDTIPNGNCNTLMDVNLTNGLQYYYVITAYTDTPSGESDTSNEQTGEPNNLNPASPSNLVLNKGENWNILNWTSVNDPNLNGYNIFRSVNVRVKSVESDTNNQGDGNILIGSITPLDQAVSEVWTLTYDSAGGAHWSVSGSKSGAQSNLVGENGVYSNSYLSFTLNSTINYNGDKIYIYITRDWEKINTSLISPPADNFVKGNSYEDNPITPLNINTRYFYLVSSINNSGYESYYSSNEVSIQTLLTPASLVTPSNLTGLTGNSVITLKWNQVSNYKYIIYRSELNGNRGFNLLTTTPISSLVYQDSTVINGSSYYYKISCYDEINDFESLLTTSTTSLTPSSISLAAPANLTVNPGNYYSTSYIPINTLTWEQDVNATSYNIFRSLNQNDGYSLVGNISGISYQDEDVNLIMGNTYYYKVTSLSATNESEFSLASNGTPIQADTPQSPSNLSVSIGNGYLSLVWDAVTLNTDSSSITDLSGYNIYRNTGGTFANTDLEKINSSIVTGTNFVDNNVINGNTYWYVVTCVDNLSNESRFSTEDSGIPSGLQPLIVTNVIALPGNNLATINWGDVTPSGETLNGYYIWRSTVADTGYSKINSGNIVDNNSYQDLTPLNGTTYYYKISWEGSVNGESGLSDYGSCTPNGSYSPNAPTNLVASPGNGRIILTWEDSQSGIKGYNLYRRISAPIGSVETYYTKVNSSIITDLYYEDNSLTNNTTYTYVVTAIKERSLIDYESSYSNTSSTTPSATGINTQVTGLTIFGGDEIIHLNWNSVINAEGYNIYRSVNSNEDYEFIVNVNGETSYQDSDLSNDLVYYYKVSPTLSGFEGPLSNFVNQVTDKNSSNSPSSLNITTGGNSVGKWNHCNWNKVTGTSITGYNLYRSGHLRYSDPEPDPSNNGIVTLNISAVSSSLAYSREWLVTYISNDEWSVTANGLTSLPNATTGVLYTYPTEGISFTVNVSGIVNPGDNISFKVVRDYSRINFLSSPSPNILGTSFIDTNLPDDSDGQVYFYRVTTVNESGWESEYSTDEVKITVPNDSNTSIPEEPENLNSNGGNSIVTIDWEDNSGDVNIVGFNIYRSIISSDRAFEKLNSSLITSTSYQDTGLINGETYYYKVTSQNSNGFESLYSTYTQSTTDSLAPLQVTNLTILPGNSIISLNWDLIDGASYFVYRSTISGSNYQKLNSTSITGTFYQDNGLTNGVTYYYVVTAFKDNLESEYSSEVNGTPEATGVPANPTGLYANSSDYAIHLHWNSNLEGDLEGYNVYRSKPNDNSNFDLIYEKFSGTDYFDYIGDLSQTYYYIITALDDIHESQLSSTVSQITSTSPLVPDKPLNCNISYGNTLNHITWDFDSNVDGYNIYKATGNAFNTSIIYNPLNGSGTISNIKVNSTATSDVWILTYSNGTGDWEVKSLINDQIQSQRAQTGVQFTTDNSEIQFTISGIPIDGDIIYISIYRNFNKINSSLLTGNTYRDTGLTNGTSYYYYVTGVQNISGIDYESLISQEVKGIPTGSSSNVPSENVLTHVIGGDSWITVRWNTLGGIVDGYNLYRRNGTDYFKVNSSPITGNVYKEEGLTSGTYNYVVTTLNLTNISYESDYSNELSDSLHTSPNLPTNVNLTSGDKITHINWDSISGADGYVIYRSLYENSGFVFIDKIGDVTSYQDENLSNSTIYFYRISSYDSDSESLFSDFDSIQPNSLDPNRPTNLEAHGGNLNNHIVWSHNSEPDLAGYNLYRSEFARVSDPIPNESNIGNGTITLLTSYDSTTLTETWTVTLTTGTTWSVTGSVSGNQGNGTTGVNYNNGLISFTINNGSTVFQDGDSFTIDTNRDYSKVNSSLILGPSYQDDLNIVNGTTYFYRVTAVNNIDLESQYSIDEIGVVPQGTSPNQVTNLQANAGDTIVTLTWDNMSTAGYNIYRSSISNTEGFERVNSSVIIDGVYQDTGLTNFSTVYYYKITSVSALTGYLESIDSSVVNGSPVSGIPEAPTSININPGDTISTIVIETAPDYATYYNIYRQDPSGGYWLLNTVPSMPRIDRALQDSGLTNSLTYNYKITSLDEFYRESLLSTGHSVIPTTPSPNTPTFNLPTEGNSTVTLVWSAQAGSGYNLYRSSISSDYGFVKVNNSLITSETYTDSDLTNYSTYYYRVTTVNGSSVESIFSNYIEATPDGSIDPIINNVLINSGDTRVTLTWDNIIGASDFDHYKVYYGTTSTGPYPNSIDNIDGTACQIESLSNGTPYYFIVRWVSSTSTEHGESLEVSVTPNTYGLATPVFSVVPGNSLNTLTWDQVADAEGYNIYRKENTNTYYNKLNNLIVTDFSYQDTTASNGVLYDYIVTSLNLNTIYYESQFSITPVSATPSSIVTILPPTNIVAYGGNKIAFINWDAAVNVTGYKVYRKSATLGYKLIQTIGEETSYQDSNLTNGSIYYYKITSTNGTYESEFSQEVNVTPNTGPTIPTNVIVRPGDSSAHINWDYNSANTYNIYRSRTVRTTNPQLNSVDNSNLTINNVYSDTTTTSNWLFTFNTSGNYWVIEQNSVNIGNTTIGAPFTFSNSEIDISISSGAYVDNDEFEFDTIRDYSKIGSLYAGDTFEDTGLTNGTSYFYTVTAVNSSLKESDYSNEISGIPTSSSVPLSPSNLSISIGNGLVHLNWDIPTLNTDNSSIVDLANFNVYRSSTINTNWVEIAVLSNEARSYRDNDSLISGNTYYYVVTALDLNNESLFSTQISGTPISTSFEIPVIYDITAGDSFAHIKWNYVPYATSYNLYRSTVSGTNYSLIGEDILSNAFVDSPLTNGTYYYVVTGNFPDGESDYSIEDSVVIDGLNVPSTPTNLEIKASLNSVHLIWDRNLEVNVTGYNIYRSLDNDTSYEMILENYNGLAYNDYEIISGETYYYVITAFDNLNKTESLRSTAVNDIPLSADIPSIPVISGISQGNTMNYIRWELSGSDITGYNIYRSTDKATNVTEALSDESNSGNGTISSISTGSVSVTQRFDIVFNQTLNQWDISGSSGYLNSLTGSSGTFSSTTISFTITPGSKSFADGDRFSFLVFGNFEKINSNPISGNANSYQDTSLTNGSDYYYVVTALNNNGPNGRESLYSEENLIEPLVTYVPTAPTNLEVTQGNGYMTLNWDNVAGTNIGYRVYRSLESGSNYACLTDTPIYDSTFQDFGIENNQTYYWVVTSVRTDYDRESDYSNEYSLYVNFNNIDAPTNLIVYPGYRLIHLNWEHSIDAVGYNVYRKISSVTNAGFIRIATIGLVNTYMDSGLSTSGIYVYKLTALASDGSESIYTNETLPISPNSTTDPIPTTLTGNNGDEMVSVSWNGTGNGYFVYRSTTVTNSTIDFTGSGNGALVINSINNSEALTETWTIEYVASGLPYWTVTGSISGNHSNISGSSPWSYTSDNGEINISISQGSTLFGDGDKFEFDTIREYSKVNQTVYQGTTYFDRNLTNGQSYFYRISSVNISNRESDYSASELKLTPLATSVPSYPTNLNITPGNTIAYLNWDSPIENTDTTITDIYTGFNIYRTNDSGTNYIRVASNISSNYYQDSGLTNGIVYYYSVTAIDQDSNESDISSESSVTGTNTGPSQVSNLNVNPGRNITTLTWDKVENVSSYNIYRSENGTDFEKVNLNPITGLAYQDTLLTNGTLYYYQVTGIDVYGTESDFSASQTVTPTDTSVPVSVTNVELTSGKDFIRITWDHNIEVFKDNYNIYRADASGLNDYSLIFEGYEGNSFVDYGLIDSKNYYYRVTCVSTDSRESEFSNETYSTVDNLTTIETVNNITSITGNSLVHIDWELSLNPSVNYYSIYRAIGNPFLMNTTTSTNTGNGTITINSVDTDADVQIWTISCIASDTWEMTGSAYGTYSTNAVTGTALTMTNQFRFTINAGTVPYSIGDKFYVHIGKNFTKIDTISSEYNSLKDDYNIINNTTYNYVITNRIDNSESLYSLESPVRAYTASSYVPAEALNLSSLAGDSQIQIYWDEPGGIEDGYNIYRNTNDGGYYTKLNSTPIRGNSYQDNSLLNGTTYYYVVVTLNDSPSTDYASDYSTIISSTPSGSTTPDAPTNVEVRSGKARITVVWDDVTDPDLIGYNVYISENQGGPYVINNSSLIEGNYFEVTGLTNGITYYIVVTSVINGNIQSVYSSEVSGTPSGTVPGYPRNIELIPGFDYIHINWTPPSTSTNLTNYFIYRKDGANTYYNKLITLNNNTLSYLDTNLTSNTQYCYIITSYNSSNIESDKTSEVCGTTLNYQVNSPTLLEVNSGDTINYLTWTETNNLNITGYNIYYSLESGSSFSKINSSPITSTFYKHESLTNNTTYYYVVTCVVSSESGESNYSNELSGTPSITPAKPIDIFANIGDREIYIEWGSPLDSDIAGWNIYRSNTSGSGYIKLNSTLIPTNTRNYTDNNIVNNTIYYYVITAIDNEIPYNESDYSKEISVSGVMDLTWTKSTNNPILIPSTTGWDVTKVYSSCIIKDGNDLKMWYSGDDSDPLTFDKIGYAYKLAGETTWTKYINNPVVDVGTSGEWDSYTVTDPTVIFDTSDNLYKMWYAGSNDGLTYSIGYATSSDGFNWTKSTNNPVIISDTGNAWDNIKVKAPTVIKDGSIYKMWYEGSNSTKSKIGYATSNDGEIWTKNSVNPVLTEGFNGSNNWSNYEVGEPTVIKVDGFYKMWFKGKDAISSDYEFGFALSIDGKTWFKHIENSFLSIGNSGDWDETEINKPCVLVEGTTYTMYYSGSNSTVTSIGYATASEDHVPPIITLTDPSNGSLDIEVDKEITINFSEEIDNSTLNSTSVNVIGSYSNNMSIGLNYSNQILTITPDNNYIPGEIITVTINTNVLDLAGNSLDGNGDGIEDGSPDDDYTFGFTIEAGTLPLPPRNLTGIALDQTVRLSWEPATGANIQGYNIYRSTTSGSYPTQPINSQIITGLNYQDTGLTNGITYYYIGKTVDNSQVESNSSNEVSVTPTSNNPVVTDDGIYTKDNTQLNGSWTVNDTTDIIAYHYSIGTNPGLTDIVSETNNGMATTVTVTGLNLINGQTYYFNVRAELSSGGFGEYGYSDGIFYLDENLDTDGDGMPDAWEEFYGLNPYVDDSLGNPDNDGCTNLEEYQNDTDPTTLDCGELPVNSIFNYFIITILILAILSIKIYNKL